MNNTVAAVAIVLSACAGFALAWWLLLEPTPGAVPEIREVVVTKTVYLKPPVTDCEKSPLQITAERVEGGYHIEAGDGCKSVAAEIRTGTCRPAWPRDTVTDVVVPAGCGVAGFVGALILLL